MRFCLQTATSLLNVMNEFKFVFNSGSVIVNFVLLVSCSKDFISNIQNVKKKQNKKKTKKTDECSYCTVIRTMLANILLVSHTVFLFHSPKGKIGFSSNQQRCSIKKGVLENFAKFSLFK